MLFKNSKVVVDVISRFNWLSVGVLSFAGVSKGGGLIFFFCVDSSAGMIVAEIGMTIGLCFVSTVACCVMLGLTCFA